MFQENLLENIKTETIMVNASYWLLKTDMFVKCFGSIFDTKIKLTLNTKKSILTKEQDCCNNICVKNEMHSAMQVYVPTVILLNINTYLEFFF